MNIQQIMREIEAVERRADSFGHLYSHCWLSVSRRGVRAILTLGTGSPLDGKGENETTAFAALNAKLDEIDPVLLDKTLGIEQRAAE